MTVKTNKPTFQRATSCKSLQTTNIRMLKEVYRERLLKVKEITK